jgi:PAS domain S-box-containing protein
MPSDTAFPDKYRNLFDNMLDGFVFGKVLFNSKGEAVDFVLFQVNKAFERLTGLTKKQVQNRGISESIPNIHAINPEMLKIHAQVALTGKGEKFEIYLEALQKWLFISIYSPKKTYFISHFENITERKANEALLKSSMERFMTLADSLPEVVFETDLSGKLTYVNRIAFELTGFTRDDYNALKHSFEMFIAPRDRERAKANFVSSIQTGSPSTQEYWMLRKDDSEFPAVVKSIPVFTEGHLVGIRGIIIDITETKKTMDKLAFQAQLLESVGQAVIAVDKENVVRYWNRGAAKLYGWSESDAVGKCLNDLVAESYPEEAYLVYSRLSAGETWSGEIQAQLRDGSVAPLIVNRYPVMVDNNEFIGFISIYTDITEQKALEYKLADYVDALADSSEKINDLNDKLLVVGSLTRHDIRNKLSAFNGLMYLMKKKILDNPDALEKLAEMQKVLKQLLDILEFQKVYELVGSEQLTFVSVGSFFNEAVELLSDSKGLQIDFKCEGLEVLADSLLRQVIYNLIDNTLKYGEKATTIHLYCQKDHEDLLLIYEDNGQGISDEERQHLFEKGFGKGTGLGLYMIKRIVTTYGWLLEEKGAFGVGVRFVMKIPAGGYRFCPQCSTTSTA